MGASADPKSLDSPPIGNPYGYYVNGAFVRTGSDYLHYYATVIGRLVRGDTRAVVLELGGGYGGLAYYLVRDHELTWVDVDLPENMALAAFYLLSAMTSCSCRMLHCQSCRAIARI